MIIATYNLKGGVGKSTTAINLAYNVALEGKRVLLIDLDPQCNATPFFTKSNEINTIYDLLVGAKTIDECIVPSRYKSISIVKGSTRLKDEICGPNALSSIMAPDIQQSFDFIIIDCRTSYEALTVSALSVTDMVLTPILLDGYCKDNLIEVQNIIEQIREVNPSLQWNIFANRLKNRKAQRKIFEELVTYNEYPLLSTCVMDRAAVENALALRKPLIRHASKNQATLDYIDLTKEIMGMGV